MHAHSKLFLATLFLSFPGCGPGVAELPESPAALQSTSSAIHSTSACSAPLPSAALAFPKGNELDFARTAIGVQIYTCTANATGAAWVFTAPEATLYDRWGAGAGKHYAGPTWQALDGSTVVGARLAGATPDATAIPWLLLGAASHAGDGRMDEVTFIQRLATSGGLAPASGCSTSTVGAVARVPYTATYCFAEVGD